MLPEAAITRNEAPSEMSATEDPCVAGIVSLDPFPSGVAPGIPENTVVPAVS